MDTTTSPPSSDTAVPSQTPKLKVLFLDIDGVINSTRTAVVNRGYPHDFKKMERFDQVALGLIRNLCALGGVSIVLSSTWRKSFHYHEVANALDLPIIDATDTDGKLRGEEIERWLKANAERVECYAIVDDDEDMLGNQLHRFCHTDGNDGLLWRDYLFLCDLFGIKNPFKDPPSRGE